MNFHEPRIPRCTIYPLDQIRTHFDGTYLTSSMAYMLALALLEHDKGEKVEEIKVFGVNLTTNAEYFEQKACLEYWIGYAKGRGIKVTLPPVTALLRGRLYAVTHDANALIAMSKTRVERWRREVLKERDMSMMGMQVVAELAMIHSRVENEKGKKDVEARATAIKQRCELHVRNLNNAVASLREAQHMLISLGGFDTTATEIPEINIPRRPFQTHDNVATDMISASAATKVETDGAKPGDNAVPEAAKVGA